MMIALLLLVPAVSITWVLFRHRDSDENESRAIGCRERDRDARAAE